MTNPEIQSAQGAIKPTEACATPAVLAEPTEKKGMLADAKAAVVNVGKEIVKGAAEGAVVGAMIGALKGANKALVKPGDVIAEEKKAEVVKPAVEKTAAAPTTQKT